MSTQWVVFECSECGRKTECPIIDDQVVLWPIYGWKFPESLCPECADKKAVVTT